MNALAWYKDDVPAPKGAFLGEAKAMVMSCGHWDEQLGDHIGKSCGEGIYHALQESVGDALGKFLTEEGEKEQFKRLRHGESWAPSAKESSMLKLQGEGEMGRGRDAIVKCAREHAHVYLWTELPKAEEVQGAEEEKKKEKGEEGEAWEGEEEEEGDGKESGKHEGKEGAHHPETEKEKKEEEDKLMMADKDAEEAEGRKEEEEGHKLWVDPIPDVVVWSKSHPPAMNRGAALNDRAAAEEIAKEKEKEVLEAKQDEDEEIEVGDGGAKGKMAVTVGNGFDQCVSRHLAHTCASLSQSTAMYGDWETGRAYAVSGQQSCREPELLGSKGAERLCAVCCTLSKDLCPAHKR